MAQMELIINYLDALIKKKKKNFPVDLWGSAGGQGQGGL